MEVTASNVYDYVRKYAEVRMIKVQEKALHSMREGVFDVLPEGALDGLTSEDLRLLLNGVGDINVSVLISYTSFNDESGESTERLVKFKRWLWSIVEKMSHVERQDLVRILADRLILLRKQNFLFVLAELTLASACRRYISGLALQRYQRARMVSNRCRP